MTTRSSRHILPPLYASKPMFWIRRIFGPLPVLLFGAVMAVIFSDRAPVWHSAGMGIMIWFGLGMLCQALVWIGASIIGIIPRFWPWTHVLGGAVPLAIGLNGLR